MFETAQKSMGSAERHGVKKEYRRGLRAVLYFFFFPSSWSKYTKVHKRQDWEISHNIHVGVRAKLSTGSRASLIHRETSCGKNAVQEAHRKDIGFRRPLPIG